MDQSHCWWFCMLSLRSMYVHVCTAAIQWSTELRAGLRYTELQNRLRLPGTAPPGLDAWKREKGLEGNLVSGQLWLRYWAGFSLKVISLHRHLSCHSKSASTPSLAQSRSPTRDVSQSARQKDNVRGLQSCSFSSDVQLLCSLCTKMRGQCEQTARRWVQEPGEASQGILVQHWLLAWVAWERYLAVLPEQEHSLLLSGTRAD